MALPHAQPIGTVRSKRMYQGAYRDELDPPDDATQQDPAANQVDPAITPKEPNPEDAPYKQRYDSLKAHYDRTVVDDRKKIAELQSQLGVASRSNISMPKSADELLAWKNQYPDLYGILVTAIRTELKGTEDTLNERINQNEALARSARRDKAEAALERLHPDFPQLRASKEFHDWVNEQPEQIKNWLYENEDDPLLAGRAIDLYKADKGLKVKDQAKPRDIRSAADAVSPNQRVADPDPTGKKQWRTSDIRKLTPRQFEKLEEEIELARSEGRLIIDI